MRPYIYTFYVLDRFYFYDVNKDEIKEISEALYCFLNNQGCHSDSVKNEISALKESGFLSDHRISTIRHPKIDNMKYYIENRCEDLILQVTQFCNLCCCYCPYADSEHSIYERNHSNKVMDWDTAKKALDLFLLNSSELENISVSFYGGEPYMAFSLIKKAVEYIDENYAGKNVYYSVTTNGTVLNDEMIEFSVKNKFHMAFSIDGPEKIHDINRKYSDGKGSFKEVIKNLKKTVLSFGDMAKEYVNINMVINPENNFDDAFSLFDDDFLSANEISISANIASDNKRDECFKLNNKFHEKFSYNMFLSFMKKYELVKGLITNQLTDSICDEQKKKRLMNNPNRIGDAGIPGGPCIAGSRKMFVNAFGDIYPCELASEVSDFMKIGNVDTGIDFNKAEKFMNFADDTSDKCRNCYAFRYCKVCGVHLCSDESRNKQCEASRRKFRNILHYEILRNEVDIFKRK